MIRVSGIVGEGGYGGELPVEWSRFPCGERKLTLGSLKIPENMLFEQISLNFKYEADSDIVDLLLIVDAIKRCPWLNYKKLVLLITYMPYGRQDRVCNRGEPHSLKVICELINSLGFDKVFIVDPHSDVVEALLNNVDLITMDYIVFAADGGPFTECDAFVSPDGGAYKKVTKCAQIHGTPIIRADKIRDVKTGNLSGFEVYADDLTGQDVLILDDICDGGGTFIGLAQKLRDNGATKVSLYVTHGKFTKGVKEILKYVDEIWCYEYSGPSDEEYLVNQIELFKE